jgi:hypothetical protein
MQRLAKETNGRFPVKPTDLNAFYDALLGQVTGLNGWTSIIKGAAVETGEKIATVSKFALGGTAVVAAAALLLFAFQKGRR